MHSKTKLSTTCLTAIALLLCSFVGTQSTFAYAAMLVLIPALAAYFFCTNSAAVSIYLFISVIVFNLVANLSGGFLVAENIILTIPLLVPGAILGICFKTKKDFKTNLLLHAAYDFLLLLIGLSVIRFVYKIDITAAIQDSIGGTFSEQIQLLKNVYPQLTSSFADSEHQLFEAMYVGVPGCVPFFAGLIFCLLFLLRYAICKILCTRFFVINNIFADGFDTFRVGAVTNFAVLVMLFLSYFSESALFTMICLNALLIITILYFVGGLSVLEHKLKQKIHYPGRRFLALIGIFIVLFVVSFLAPIVNFIYVFVFLGFADSLFDFRKLNSKKDDI